MMCKGRNKDGNGVRNPHTSPKLSRRRFLWGSAAATALAMVPAVGIGCGGDEGGGRGRNGRLRAAFVGGGSSETVDPHGAVAWIDAARGKALFDRLVEYRADMSLEMRLAESIEPNEDATEWRVALRDGVEFHDGKMLTADDVMYSIRRILRSEFATTAAAGLEPLDLDNSRAEGDRTVVFALDRPVSEFPNALAVWGVLMVPEGTEDFSEPVGTGPFRFRSFEPGRGSVFVRNENYWDGAPEIEELEMVSIEDEGARINALLGGQVDYADELSSSSARSQEGSDRVKIMPLRNSSVQAFVMKMDRPPFDDPRVRKAFRLMIDREQLLENVFGGYGSVGNDVFGLGFEYYNDELPQRRHDPEETRALLRAAGAEGLSVDILSTESNTGFVEAATLFAEQAKEVGVDIGIKRLDGESFWERTIEDGSISNWRSGAMPIETRIGSTYLSDGAQNYARWERPEFDDLYQSMQRTLDEDEKRGYYFDVQEMLWEEGGDILWGFTDWIVGTAPNLEGLSDDPQNTYGWANFHRARFF